MMDIIFDIDGTLTDPSHRRHLVEGPGKKNWPRFLELAGEDPPRGDMINLAIMLQKGGARLVLATGRYEHHRAMTESWLAHHGKDSFARVPLFMRENGDSRGDDVIKIEMLGKIRSAGFTPLVTIDDRDRVVKAWRAAGLTCLQCAEGDF